MQRPIRLCAVVVAIASSLAATSAHAQGSTTAERLIQEEQLRQSVEDAYELAALRNPNGGIKIDNMVRAVDLLVAIGPEAVPFVTLEAQQDRPDTYFFSVYALGRLGTEEAAQALREMIAEANQKPGVWASQQIAWCSWALGLMGLPEAVDLLLDGKKESAQTPIHGNFTVLDSVAVQTAPDSLPRLMDHWGKIDVDEDTRYALRATLLNAVGLVPNPDSREFLTRVLREEHPILAREAAFGLGHNDSPESVQVLVSALDMPDVRVRRGVALALKDALPVGRLEGPVKRLETEDNPIVRGALYSVIARAGGPPYTDVLVAAWGREDPIDRRQLVQVLPMLDHAKVLPTLLSALRDPDNQVAVAAAAALAELNLPEATQALIDRIRSPFWPVASTSIDLLVELYETRAVDAVAGRLIDVELAGVVVDPHIRMHIEALGEALVALGGTARLDALREAAARQKDGHLTIYLEGLIGRLETLQDNGRKFKRWLETLASPDADSRLLAYDYFSRHGNAKSATAMAEMFGRVEFDEGLAILDALSHVDCEATRELIQRVLMAPEFDLFERSELRDMAAWTARRIGGGAMQELLRASVERRHGRDTRPLIYYAVLAGADSIPVLDRYRLVRMRYITWKRGDEMKRLDWIRRELAHGRSVASVDVPPQKLTF